MEPKTLLSTCQEKPILKQLLKALCDPKILGIVFENLTEIKKDGLLALAEKTLSKRFLILIAKQLKLQLHLKLNSY